jgi:uridine kinase
MHYRIYKHKDVEFLDLRTSSGQRTYTRTLFFILCKAAHDLWPDCRVMIDIPVSNGYYVDVLKDRNKEDNAKEQEITPDDVHDLRVRMQEIIDAGYDIHRHESTTAEAIEMFRQMGSHSKVKLLENSGRLYTTFYDIDGYMDYYYGTLLTNTSEIKNYGLEYYYMAFCCASRRVTILPD